MKVECQAIKIKSAILNADKITAKNITLPILNSLLIIASGKSLKIRATNLSIGIEIEIPAKIEKEGVVAVKGVTIASLFGTLLKDEPVFIELVSENLKVSTKHNTTLIKSYPHDDFPTIPRVQGSSISIPIKLFVSGVESVYYSASTSDIKPEIASVYIYTNDDGMVFVATDSFRLAEKKIKMKKVEHFDPILIPYKNIIEIIRILKEYDDICSMSITKNQISFSLGGLYITSRIIDSVFPDYKQIIPKAKETEVVVLKQELFQALKVSNIFSDKFNQITLTIKPKDKKFLLHSKNNDVGESTVQVFGTLKGNEIEVNLNYKYFLECFQSIGEDSVVISCNEVNKPIVINGAGDSSFTYLIMPMNR